MIERKKAPAAKVDEQWFKLQIARAGHSLRSFAGALKLDPASMHRTLKGKRKPLLPEIQRMQEVLEVPMTDVLSHLGLKMDSIAVGAPGATVRIVKPAAGRAPLAGEVDAGDGSVTFQDYTKPQSVSVVVALAIRGDAFLDGWRVLCVPSDVSPVPTDDLGAGIVQLKDGRMLLRKIRPGFTKGRFDLGPVFGFGGREDDAEVVGVIPVLGLEQA